MEQQQQTGTPLDAVEVGKAAQARMGRQAKGESVPVNLPDMVAIMARLAQVLAEEVDHLDAMQIKKIEGLQDEKRKLSRTLAIMKRELDRQPELLESTDAEDVAAFQKVARIFDEVLQENHRKLLVAKEINYRVVQAISDVVEEEALRPGYNQRGTKARRRDGTPSVSLNETI